MNIAMLIVGRVIAGESAWVQSWATIGTESTSLIVVGVSIGVLSMIV